MSSAADSPAAGSANLGSPWLAFLDPFAKAIGKTADEVSTALSTVVGAGGDTAIRLLQNEKDTPYDELRAVFSGVPSAVLRSAVASHLRQAPSPAPSSAPASVILGNTLLPAVPDDEAWLKALKTGGRLKVDKATVMGAVRAGLASRTGLFNLPERLVTRLERHADSLDEPVGEDYLALHDLLTKRSYAEIFSALKVDGRKHVTQRRKTEFLQRLDALLWPSLQSFQRQLKVWIESWQSGFSNPGTLVQVLASLGSGGGPLGPTLLPPPSTQPLMDSAEAVVNEINRVFAGVGILVSSALAWDAKQIRDVLSNPTLPIQVGLANRDQMLKELKIGVSGDYVRLENSLTQYVLAIMDLTDQVGGAHEQRYLTEVYWLGQQIPWDKLDTPPQRPAMQRGTRLQDDDDDEK